MPNDKIVVRAEDVPFFVEEMSKNEKPCVGLTGEDLFKEFTLKKQTNLVIKQKIPWIDKNALFGKPAICLLGKTPLKENSRVAINSKYKNIAETYLKNKKVKKYYFSGCTETAFEKGIADFVIDIVYSGKSAKKAGLEVIDKIFESNIVLLEVRK